MLKFDPVLGEMIDLPGFQPVADHVFAHDVYGACCYLDDDNPIGLAGYQKISIIELAVVSADSNVTGNIVLECGTKRFVVPVTGTVARRPIGIDAEGIVSIVRDTASDDDTLKDAEGNIVTALVVDWRAV